MHRRQALDDAHTSLVLLTFLAAAMALSACGELEEDMAFDTQADEVVEKNFGWFNRNKIVSDAYFTSTGGWTSSAIQRFFERTPYGRSWLASERIGHESAADMVARVARQYRINPMLLIARIQVESSTVAQASRPSQWKINRLLGCGCPDGYDCAYAPPGLDGQLQCAGEKLRELFDLSASGRGWWQRNSGRHSSDGSWINPQNHATAALYAYTPWVLEGRGGNWLVWKILKEFESHGDRFNMTQDTTPTETDVHATNAHSETNNHDTATPFSGDTCASGCIWSRYAVTIGAQESQTQCVGGPCACVVDGNIYESCSRDDQDGPEDTDPDVTPPSTQTSMGELGGRCAWGCIWSSYAVESGLQEANGRCDGVPCACVADGNANIECEPSP